MKDNANVEGLDELHNKLQDIKDYLQHDLADVVGIEAVKFFKGNFDRERFGSRGKKWAPRKTLRDGGTNGQKVLSKSGELSESIDYTARSGYVIISSDKVYAEIHNDGGEITVTPKMRGYFWAMHKQAKDAGNDDMADQWKGLALAKKIVMPERQFIGESPELIDNIEDKVDRDLTKLAS